MSDAHSPIGDWYNKLVGQQVGHDLIDLKNLKSNDDKREDYVYVAAECERPYFSHVLSAAPRAHTNSLRVSHGYARTYMRSWPIRLSHPTGQSGRLSACHA